MGQFLPSPYPDGNHDWRSPGGVSEQLLDFHEDPIGFATSITAGKLGCDNPEFGFRVWHATCTLLISNSTGEVRLWEDTMSQSMVTSQNLMVRTVRLAALLSLLLACAGCVSLMTNPHSAANGDPLQLGINPGPQGSTTPQTIQVRLGSEPNDRLVSVSLTINSLQTRNSGNETLDLLTDPVTLDLAHNAVVTDPLAVRDIYQDTYSDLTFPDMTGEVVFYDVNGQLMSQTVNVPGGTLPYTLVLGGEPQILNIWIDLSQTFTVIDTAGARRDGRSQADSQGSSSIAVNSLSLSAASTSPNPAVGQPESGSFSFAVGKVTSVNTTAKTITVQPTSGDSMKFYYDDSTDFENCNPSMLLGMIVESEGVTQTDGHVLASEIELIDNSQSGSELYGQISGYAPDGMNYSLIVQGGIGVNVTSGLLSKSVTLDWLGASYTINHGRIPSNLSFFDEEADGHLIFDESHVFPGQLVEVEWDTLIVPDPDSNNAGFMQPRMFELEEQTISGQVSGYQFDEQTQTGSFTLNVANSAPIKRMNPGLTGITVHRIPETYLRSNPTFANGDQVKVRGLLFVDPYYNNANYYPSPGNPVAFVMIADRISK